MVATHDFGTVDPVLDRAAILRDGKLVAMESGGRTLRDAYYASRTT